MIRSQVTSVDVCGDILTSGLTAASAHNLPLTLCDGINRNTQIHLPDGTCWLLKEPRVDFRTGELTSGVDREGWFYEQVWRGGPVEHLRTFIPELIHYNAEHHFLILRYLKGWETLYDYHQRTGRYPTSVARRIAELLASVHWDSYVHPEKYIELRSRGAGRPISLLGTRITPEQMAEFPEDGIKLVTLVQRYPEMSISLETIKDAWHPTCLIHKDIKQNNFMKPVGPVGAKGPSLILVDWEFWDWGDPAWDVGAALGGYLMGWLSSLNMSKGRSIEEWFATAELPFDQVQPAVNALWARYVDLCGPILRQRRGFSKLVIQYAGLFLLIRTVVALMAQGYLSVRSLCELQVAKNLLVQPEKHAGTLLGGDSSL